MTPAARIAAAIEVLDEGLAGYGPAPLTAVEQAVLDADPDLTLAEQADLSDWLWPMWQDNLGADAMSVAQTMRHRAPVTLRVNHRRADVDDVMQKLLVDGIVTRKIDNSFALQVIENEPGRV